MRQSVKALRHGEWRAKAPDGVQNHVNLLVSILVRYPQIVTLELRPDEQALILSFMVRGELGARKIASLRRRLTEALDVFGAMTERPVGRLTIVWQGAEGYTLLEVRRSTESLTHSELSLIVGLLHDAFGSDLVWDGEPLAQADEREAHEALIDHVLAEVRTLCPQRHLVGYRTDGRVFVFNRPSSEGTGRHQGRRADAQAAASPPAPGRG